MGALPTTANHASALREPVSHGDGDGLGRRRKCKQVRAKGEREPDWRLGGSNGGGRGRELARTLAGGQGGGVHVAFEVAARVEVVPVERRQPLSVAGREMAAAELRWVPRDEQWPGGQPAERSVPVSVFGADTVVRGACIAVVVVVFKRAAIGAARAVVVAVVGRAGGGPFGGVRWPAGRGACMGVSGGGTRAVDAGAGYRRRWRRRPRGTA